MSIITCIDTGEVAVSYSAYLRTKHWNMLREKYFTLNKNICCWCGSVDYVQLHHLNYKNIGKESLDDLVPLCKSCHKELHKVSRDTKDVSMGAVNTFIKKYRNAEGKKARKRRKKKKNTGCSHKISKETAEFIERFQKLEHRLLV